MWNGKDFGFKTNERLEAFICIEGAANGSKGRVRKNDDRLGAVLSRQ
jgi:hypothetical protein